MTVNKKTPPAKAAAKKKVAAKASDPIEVAIEKFEKKLRDSKEELKLADYMKLLQIRKEREESLPRQITVRWIESWEKEPAS